MQSFIINYRKKWQKLNLGGTESFISKPVNLFVLGLYIDRLELIIKKAL